jgi:ATP-binding cassette subfamily B protein
VTNRVRSSAFGLRRVRRTVERRARQWSDFGRMWSRLAPYLRRQRGRFILATLCGVGFTAAGLAEPWTLKLILDNVVLSRPLSGAFAPLGAMVDGNRLALLNVLVVAILLIAAARGSLYYFQQLLTARVGQQVTTQMRAELYGHLQRLSFTFHDRRRTGDLLARLTSDIRLLRDIFVSLPIAITSELFLVVGMTAVMFVIDVQLTLLALAVVPALAVSLRLYQKPMRKAIRRQREREGDIASIASEVLGAIKVVQGFHREQHEVDRFNLQNRRSLRTGLKAARLEAKLRWYAEVTVAVVTALVLGIAARRVLAGALSPGDLIVFVSYLRTFNRPLRRVSRMAERSARGVTAGERVLELLAVEPEVRDAKDAIVAPQFLGEIRFDDVHFQHRKHRPVLMHVRLTIEPGERVGLVGPTGVGKSTLVSLIPRFYDPTSGRVLIDGRDVRDYTLPSLRSQISLVFQEPVLFATTVAENIAYGCPDATEQDIVAAAQRAGIDPVISALPDGYATVLGERGGTLSGGQRQCVAIARAIIKDAPIVILDEPLVGLDGRSSDLVLRALTELMHGRTVIIISHRLVNLQTVDRIVHLDDGQVVDQGSHADLVARDRRYCTLMRAAGAEAAS